MALQKRGTVSDTLKGCAALAQEEALGLVNALGGEERISEQRMILVQDCVRLGLVLRAVMSRFLQGDGDPEGSCSSPATLPTTQAMPSEASGRRLRW